MEAENITLMEFKQELCDDEDGSNLLKASDSNDTTVACDNNTIKGKITRGEYKISMKRGKSRVWSLFGRIIDASGEIIPNFLVCRKCLNIYAFKNKQTSNLVRHRCYTRFIQEGNEKDTELELDDGTKLNCVRIVTKWIIQNSRSLNIVEDEGLLEIADYLIKIGAKHGRNIDLQTLLPKRNTISKNIEHLYTIYAGKVREEISSIERCGYGLTSNLWTDNFTKTTYVSVTMHFIKNGQLFSRLLGLKPMKAADDNLKCVINAILNNFNFELDDKTIVVTEKRAEIQDMNAKLDFGNKIYCINHLLHSSVEEAIKQVPDINELFEKCTNLLEYFKKLEWNSTLETSLDSYAPTRWNTVYYVFATVEQNLKIITNTLKKNNESDKMNNINLSLLTAVNNMFKPFEEATKNLECQADATLHLTYVYIHQLKKHCIIREGDLEMIKELKEKLTLLMNSIVLKNLTIFHQIALFLFPPANKLVQFSKEEKMRVKDECKRWMNDYFEETYEHKNESVKEEPVLSSKADLFSDFVQLANYITTEDKINNELHAYEIVNVIFHDDFNLLQWWHLHQVEFPLLYKISCKILATPASSIATEKIFCKARNLIADDKSAIATNPDAVNEIMFLHSNAVLWDISNEMENEMENEIVL